MNLLEAINSDNIEAVALIIANKAREHEINSVDNHGWTPLHHAVFTNNINLVEMILNHKKTNVLAECYEGCTALFLACKKVKQISVDIVELLLTKNSTLVEYVNNELVSPLHEACNSGRLDLVQLLVRFGAPVNYTDLDGDTPLHIAARFLNIDIINYFLYATDCDPTIVNNCNLNPLKCAYLSEDNYNLSAECIKVLLVFIYDETTTEQFQFVYDDFEKDFMRSISLYNLEKSFIIVKSIYCSPQYNKKATFINDSIVCFKGNELYELQFIMLMHDFYNFNISPILIFQDRILSIFITYFIHYIIEYNDIEKPLKIIYEMLSIGFKIDVNSINIDVGLKTKIYPMYKQLLQKYFYKILPFVSGFGKYYKEFNNLFIPCSTDDPDEYYNIFKKRIIIVKVHTLQSIARFKIRCTVFKNCPKKYTSWDRIKQLKKLEISRHLINYLTYEY